MLTTPTPGQIAQSLFDENFYHYDMLANHLTYQREVAFTNETRYDLIVSLIENLLEFTSEGKDLEAKQDLAYEWVEGQVDIMDWRLHESVKFFHCEIDQLIEEKFQPKNLTNLIQTAQFRAYENFTLLVLDLMENNPEE